MIDRLLVAIGDERLNGSETVVMVQAGGAESIVDVPQPWEAPELVAAVQVSLWLATPMEARVFDKATDVLLECLSELATRPDEWKRYRVAYGSLVQRWRA